MSENPRPCRVVLSEALAELGDREARLAKLGAELAETRTAIKALRKLVGERSASVPAPPREASQPGELQAAAIEAVRTSLDPLTQEEIAQRLGRTARGLPYALGAAVRRGDLVLIGSRYGTPAAGATAEDLAAANQGAA